MNGSPSLLRDFEHILKSPNFVLGLPFPLIALARHLNKNAKIAAQDCSVMAGNGAYTGEVSADMLKECGVEYIIIGHSERRAIFHETSETINNKIKNAVGSKVRVIYCVSEEFENQIENDLKGIDHSQLIIAYEPVSAIGTGLTPSIEDIDAAISKIKQHTDGAVLYGGSVSGSNIASIISIGVLDGVLVGGASLKIGEVVKMLAMSEI